MSRVAYADDAERWAWEQSPTAGWIDGPDGPVFAWYHPPRAPLRSRAVLLSDALASDRMNLHLGYRHLALRLSAAGYPAMRFDYPGTGDSSGSPRDPGWSDHWQESFSRALDTLLDSSGLDRAAVFGARFGGTLAAQLAVGRPEVDAMLLWGPFLSGREFLRSARAMHKLMGSNPAGRRPDNTESGDEEFLGYLLGRTARDRIEAARLLELGSAPCAQAQLIAWDEYSKEDVLASHLESLGVEVACERLEGLCSDDSISSQAVPEQVIARAIEWLDERTPPLAAVPDRALAGPSLQPRALVRRSAEVSGEIEERTIRFGADEGLFGILSGPPGALDGASATRLVLVNGGNNHRAGINRNYTEWARDAAQRGVVSLRFDVRGLGDSPPLRWPELNQLYRNDTREDVLAAIDAVSASTPEARIVVAGVCAGAYQALHAARIDPRVDALVLLDLLKWDPNTPSSSSRGFVDRRRRQLTRWRNRLFARLGLSASLGRSSLAVWLDELTRRGVEVIAVGCRDGGGYQPFVDALGEARTSLERSGRFWLYGLDDADHIFSPIWAQQEISRILMRHLDGSSTLSQAGADLPG